MPCVHPQQDIIRKTMGDELPDFYNIVLERPRDDPSGYDVIFIDAAAKAAALSFQSPCLHVFTSVTEGGPAEAMAGPGV